MPLYLPCSPPKSLLTLIFPLLPTMYVLPFLFQLTESGSKFIAFVEELPHLCEQDCVGEVESAILVVVGEVVVFFGLLHLVVKIKL